MAKRKLWYLKEWRLARGLTLEQLANAVNEITESWGDRAMKLSKSDVSKLERGARRYNSDHLEAFAQVLKAEPGDIVSYTPQEADEIKRIVGAIVKRGRPIDLRLLRTLAGDDEDKK
jgi:transcriptional regulator with XRE-family HTH domain